MAKKTVYKQFDVPNSGSGVVDLDNADFIDSSFVDTDGYIKLGEQATAPDPGANKGSLWVKSSSPTTAWFTDSNGTDYQLGVGGSPPELDGYVTGPASATDTAITLFDGTTGKLVKNSGVTIDGSNNINLPGELRFTDSGQYVGFDAPTLTASQIWTLPSEDGYAGSILTTDGYGTLSWVGNQGSIAFIDSNTNSADAASITLTAPSGILDGDLLVAIVCHSRSELASPITWTPPSGFDEVVTNVQVPSGAISRPGSWVWFKFANGESGNYTFTPSNSGGMVGIIICYRGVCMITPQDVAYTTAAATNEDIDPSSITTITNNAYVLAIGFKDDGSSAIQATSAGYDQRGIVSINPGSGNGASLAACDNEINPAGTETPGFFDTLASDEWAAITMALRPGPPSVLSGPPATTDNAIARWDGTDGTKLQNSAASIDDDGYLYSNQYILGTGPDLGMHPVANGQSVIASWWGLQLNGHNRASVRDYIPGNVGNNNDWSVVVAPGSVGGNVNRSILGVVSDGGSADLQQWCNNSLTALVDISSTGDLDMHSNNILNVNYIESDDAEAPTAGFIRMGDGTDTSQTIYAYDATDNVNRRIMTYVGGSEDTLYLGQNSGGEEVNAIDLEAATEITFSIGAPDVVAYITAVNNAGVLTLRDQDGTIADNDVMGRINFTGDDAPAANTTGAYIAAVATGNWSSGTSNAQPTSIEVHCQDSTGTNTLTTASAVFDVDGIRVNSGVSGSYGLVSFGGEVSLSTSGTISTLDWNDGQKQGCTLTGNLTISAFGDPPGPCNLVLRITQSSGGSNTVTFNEPNLEWPGGTAPTMTATANATDIFSFYYAGGGVYYGVASQNFS